VEASLGQRSDNCVHVGLIEEDRAKSLTEDTICTRNRTCGVVNLTARDVGV